MGLEILPEIMISFMALMVTILSVAIAYLEYKLHKKEVFEERIVQPLTSAKQFYNESERIHRTFSQVRIVSKTPGLILPSERDLAPFRKEYFQTIYSRLDEFGDYRLRYLFDLPNFKEVLIEHKARGESSKIGEIKAMISKAVCHANLDLRAIDTEPLMGMVIGGEATATIGFKEPAVKNLAEGILVKSSELLRVLMVQFDTLFAKAKRIENADFVDEILRETAK